MNLLRIFSDLPYSCGINHFYMTDTLNAPVFLSFVFNYKTKRENYLKAQHKYCHKDGGKIYSCY